MALSLSQMVLALLAAPIADLVVSLETHSHPATALLSRVFQRSPLKSASRLGSHSVLASAASRAAEFRL